MRRAVLAVLGVGEEEYPLATNLRGASVGPVYLARPTRSEEGRPSGPRCGGRSRTRWGRACGAYQYDRHTLLDLPLVRRDLDVPGLEEEVCSLA